MLKYLVLLVSLVIFTACFSRTVWYTECTRVYHRDISQSTSWVCLAPGKFFSTDASCGSHWETLRCRKIAGKSWECGFLTDGTTLDDPTPYLP